MKLLLLFLPVFVLLSCSDKYKMYDMAYDKEVAVDDLIESGEYSTHLCNGEIDVIFKTVPPFIDPSNEGQLYKQMATWANEQTRLIKIEERPDFSYEGTNILQDLKYVHTYILAEEPMHVFSLCITVTPGIKKESSRIPLFIRIDEKGIIAGEYIDNPVIINECTKEIECPYFD